MSCILKNEHKTDQTTMRMPSFNVSMFLPILSLLSFLSLNSEAVPEYRYHFCSNQTTFTRNSTYQSNLNHLLSSLSSNSMRESGFYNTTVGQTPETTVYGLFFCRGDLTPDECRYCVSTATKEIVEQYCPVEKVVVIWYDECVLRYSNKSFFSTMDEIPSVSLYNIQNTTEQDRFFLLLGASMNEIGVKASTAPPGAKKFATKEANFSELQTTYSLVQCDPLLSSSDCSRCFVNLISNLLSCCAGKQGGNFLNPSCYIRYEIYPFYRVQSAPSLAPESVLVAPPPPNIVTTRKGKGKISSVIIIAIVVTIAASVVLVILAYCFLRRRARKKSDAIIEESPKQSDGLLNYHAASEISAVESLQFDFVTIEAATNKFSDDNKIGEGGFGKVYKGVLLDQKNVAVKRLSTKSLQGLEEFKNEIVLIAKLQHKNLVRLLGFGIEGEEKLLVYEFMPNKSLDIFIFDSKRRLQLNWKTYYNIISGIARGLLYLHEDSRLKIIHRDLKPSNVLLDHDMVAKISDFGMARIFSENQNIANTKRVVGT
ncbi:hypothetical protein RGQ29_019334 [Quercus rubra]|nr:hypothetical protein RGQ29_019334 [Quercus rubra]